MASKDPSGPDQGAGDISFRKDCEDIFVVERDIDWKRWHETFKAEQKNFNGITSPDEEQKSCNDDEVNDEADKHDEPAKQKQIKIDEILIEIHSIEKKNRIYSEDDEAPWEEVPWENTATNPLKGIMARQALVITRDSDLRSTNLVSSKTNKQTPSN